MPLIPTPSVHNGGLSIIRREAEMEMSRRSAREEPSRVNPPKLPPNKERGALTPKQQRTNDARDQFVEILASKSKVYFYDAQPPPPDSPRMVNEYNSLFDVPERIYRAKPVKQVPYASQVLSAYNRFQSDSLWAPHPSLHKVTV